jgi:hypothetical protein
LISRMTRNQSQPYIFKGNDYTEIQESDLLQAGHCCRYEQLDEAHRLLNMYTWAWLYRKTGSRQCLKQYLLTLCFSQSAGDLWCQRMRLKETILGKLSRKWPRLLGTCRLCRPVFPWSMFPDGRKAGLGMAVLPPPIARFSVLPRFRFVVPTALPSILYHAIHLSVKILDASVCCCCGLPSSRRTQACICHSIMFYPHRSKAVNYTVCYFFQEAFLGDFIRQAGR